MLLGCSYEQLVMKLSCSSVSVLLNRCVVASANPSSGGIRGFCVEVTWDWSEEEGEDDSLQVISYTE